MPRPPDRRAWLGARVWGRERAQVCWMGTGLLLAEDRGYSRGSGKVLRVLSRTVTGSDSHVKKITGSAHLRWWEEAGVGAGLPADCVTFRLCKPYDGGDGGSAFHIYFVVGIGGLAGTRLCRESEQLSPPWLVWAQEEEGCKVKEMQEPGERWVLSGTPCPGKGQATRGPQKTHCTMESPVGAHGSCSDGKTQASPTPSSPPGSSLVSPDHPGLHARGVHMLAWRYTGTEGRRRRERGAATLHCVWEVRVDGKPWRPEGGQRMGKFQKEVLVEVGHQGETGVEGC